MKLDSTNASAMNFNDGVHKYLQDICQPLFKKSGVTFFEYTRVFFDNTCINIATNQKWLVHNYTKCPMGTLIEKNLKRIPVGTTRYIPYGYNEEDLQNPMLQQAYSFDIWNGLYIYKRYATYCECFCMASSKANTRIMDFYMNEQMFLERFILYFKEKAKPFIDIYDPSKRTVFQDVVTTEELIDPNGVDPFDDITPKKFLFLNEGEDLWLSKRESQCLCLYAYGKTVKEIAVTLGLTPNTIQTHINSVKTKSNKLYRSDLISFFHDNAGTSEHMNVFL
jgi:hypothetical protein